MLNNVFSEVVTDKHAEYFSKLIVVLLAGGMLLTAVVNATVTSMWVTKLALIVFAVICGVTLIANFGKPGIRIILATVWVIVTIVLVATVMILSAYNLIMVTPVLALMITSLVAPYRIPASSAE